MSTNPFDDNVTSVSSTSIGGASRRSASSSRGATAASSRGMMIKEGGSLETSTAAHQQQLSSSDAWVSTSHAVVSGGGSNNNSMMMSSTSSATTGGEPPIWAARNVDWPIPSALSFSNFQKLLRASKLAGQQLGIQQQQQQQQARIAAAEAASQGGANPNDPASLSAGDSTSKESKGTAVASAAASTTGGSTATSTTSDGASAYYNLTGFMSRVLNTTTAGSGGTSSTNVTGDSNSGNKVLPIGGGSTTTLASTLSPEEAALDAAMFVAAAENSMGGTGSSGSNNNNAMRPIRPPRPGCVAAANGWIVAALECPIFMNTAQTTAGAASLAGAAINDAMSSSASIPILRLVSRWNVRRGGGMAVDQWMALPPPISGDGRILHVFVDPTASHTLLSAANGELYYIHSSGQSKQAIKLPGFGIGIAAEHTAAAASTAHRRTGSSSATTTTAASMAASKLAGSLTAAAGRDFWLTGIPATAVAYRRDDASQASIQMGLTSGTYVTAVAWDKERGTEGSTKKILLGTSGGEIYEYGLTAPNSEGDNSSGMGAANKDDTKVASKFTSSTSSSSTTMLFEKPVLLHKLYSDAAADTSEVGAAVSGLYFERLRTGLLVLAATSGRHKRTRFYTFYSAHNSSFRMVMADQQHASLVELPGSVDFADLKLCNDHFGLRTATGIYYGTIDRQLAGPAVLSGTSSMIVESGILPYDLGTKGGGGSSSSSIPVSLALTPHHLITLFENNEVRFINRVAQKIVQRERVDVGSQAMASASLDETHMGVGSLLMDIRRPDQVWLRKARSLVHISSSQEDRDVWKFTLQKCLDMHTGSKSSRSNAAQTPVAAKPAPFDRYGAGGTTTAALTDEERAQESLFEQAKTLCTNAAQKAVVTTVRAEYHLSQGRAELAAKYLAQCPPLLEPFADTAIRLALPKLGIDDHASYGGTVKARAALQSSNMPLIHYLSDKMRVGKLNDDKMTCTMLGAWLTELYLHERGERLNSASVRNETDPAGTTTAAAAAASVRELESAQRAMLAQFLNNNVNGMDAKTIMKILTSHDVAASECSTYAAKSGDIETAVNAALSVGSKTSNGAYDALRILNDAAFEQAEPLYYKHASTFLARTPVAAGDSFLARYAEGLSPLRLLPSIMNYERIRAERARVRQAVESQPSFGGIEETKSSLDVSVDGPKTAADGGFELRIGSGLSKAASFVDDSSVSAKYLEGVIRQGCRSSAIYNYLLSLYAKLDDEEPLFNFLAAHVPAGETLRKSSPTMLGGTNDEFSSPLDMSYALRTVLTTGRHFRSAIKLYMGFGMRQQAVELALKVDPTLARALAQDSVELEERKRLWLMIAKNAASDSSIRGGKDVVSRVVSVLRDCGPDVLSIEDVLPFLPDFAQIDQIKDEICEALTSYSSRIEGFLKEMNDCDRMCDNLRVEIGRLRSHRMRMKADARCGLTNKLVLASGEPFYVFPSGYVVLASALKKEVAPYLNDTQRARVDELERHLMRLAENDPSRSPIQTELDGLLAAECPLTGSIMVESIDRDFEDGVEIDGGGDLFRSSSVERVEV